MKFVIIQFCFLQAVLPSLSQRIGIYGRKYNDFASK